MATELTLNAYSYFADVKDLTKDECSSMDYVCLLFEASFKHSEGSVRKKIHEENIVFAASLILDYYVPNKDNKSLNINFDMLESNDDGVSCETLREYLTYSDKAYRPKTSKKYNIEGDYSIKVKKDYSITINDQYSSLTEAFQDFYQTQIESKISQIEEYLKKNKIGFDQSEFQRFIGYSLRDSSNIFTKDGMSSFEDKAMYSKVYEVDAMLSSKNLEKELPLNSTVSKKNKI